MNNAISNAVLCSLFIFEASPVWPEQSLSSSVCDGIYFSEFDCGYGQTYSFPEAECIKANITVAGTNNYLSATSSCSEESGCTWRCYSDENCSTKPTVYSGFSCDCKNLDNTININGNDMSSSQGYKFGSVCSDMTFYFDDCVERVFTYCYAFSPTSISMQASGTCINSNTMELCRFSASEGDPYFSETINCPSCNATGHGSIGDPGATCTDNVICFDKCQSTQCLEHMSDSQHYFYGCEVKNYKTCESDLYYRTVNATGTCLNPKTGKLCDFSLYNLMNLINDYTTVCSSCSAYVTAYPSTPSINNITGCSPIDCLPACHGNDDNESHRKNLIIIASSVGGGVLLLTAAAIIYYKYVKRAGYQRISH
ncbi:hypothetical protein [Endozoicomonas sp. 2B-B]